MNCNKDHCTYKAKYRIGEYGLDKIYSCGEHLNYFLSGILDVNMSVTVRKVK